MYKEEFIKYLSRKYRRSQKHYREALNEMLDGMQHQLTEGKKLYFLGFGTFYTRLKKGGKAFNFKTKKPMEYKPVRQVAFKVGDVLKQAVRRKKVKKGK